MAAGGIKPDCGDADQRTAGKGVINFAPLFTSAKGKTKYYFAERDPVAIGGATNFNPFVNSAESAVAMKGDPAPSLKASPKFFSSVPVGTPAADNQAPIQVTNDGDAPLVIPNGDNAIRILAERRGRRRCHGLGLLRRQRELPRQDAGAERELHAQRRLQADPLELRLGRPHRDRVQQRRRRGADPDRRRADAAEGARVPWRRRHDRDRRRRRSDGARR